MHVSMPSLMCMHAQHSFFESASFAYAYRPGHMRLCKHNRCTCAYLNMFLCQLASIFVHIQTAVFAYKGSCLYSKIRKAVCILLEFLFLCLCMFTTLHVHDIQVYPCMYVAMCMHAHSHTCINIHIHTFIHAYIHMYTCSYIQNHMPFSFQAR